MKIDTKFEPYKLMTIINGGGDISFLIDHHLDDEILKALNKKIGTLSQNTPSMAHPQ